MLGFVDVFPMFKHVIVPNNEWLSFTSKCTEFSVFAKMSASNESKVDFGVYSVLYLFTIYYFDSPLHGYMELSGQN